MIVTGYQPKGAITGDSYWISAERIDGFRASARRIDGFRASARKIDGFGALVGRVIVTRYQPKG